MDPLSTAFAALADLDAPRHPGAPRPGPDARGRDRPSVQISAPAISRHLRVLEQAGLIERQIDAQWRVCRPCAGPVCARRTTGSRNTASSGKRASTAWSSTWCRLHHPPPRVAARRGQPRRAPRLASLPERATSHECTRNVRAEPVPPHPRAARARVRSLPRRSRPARVDGPAQHAHRRSGTPTRASAGAGAWS